MKNRRGVLTMAFAPFLFLLIGAHAQEHKTVTLNEAIALSIKNSHQLKLSSAHIGEAIAATKEAVEKRLPDVTISGSYLQIGRPDINVNKGIGGSTTGGIAAGNVSQALYGIANAAMPIYSGNKVKYAIASAKYLELAAGMDADNDRQDVILNTIAAYVNLYKADASVKIVAENLLQARQRDSDFANLEKNGLLARNDLLKAQLETSNLELALVDAQNDIQLATVNMNLMLGLPEPTRLTPDSGSLRQPEEIKTIEEYERLASQNRNDIKALSYRGKAADAATKMVRGDYYPGIALTGGYIAADVPGLLRITNALNVGIGAKYSLSSLWKTNAKLQQAKSREQQLQATEAGLNDEIHLAIYKAFNDYLSGIKKAEVYKKAVEQASENYRISKNKYDNNLLTLADLLDADVAQLQAKLNLSFAKADIVLAYHTLLRKAGLLTQ